MTAAPPQALPNGDILVFQVNIDINSYEKKILESIEHYLTILPNLHKFDINGSYLNDSENINKLKCFLGKEIKSLSSYLSQEQKSVINNRLSNLGFSEPCTPEKFAPEILNLITSKYFLQISFLNANGNKIQETQSLVFNGDLPRSLKDYCFLSPHITIPKNTSNIHFKLSEANLLNREIQKRLSSIEKGQLDELEIALKAVKANLNDAFFANYRKLDEKSKEAKKFLEDQTSIALNQKWINAANRLLNLVENPVKASFLSLDSPDINEWIVGWLWLTKGIPKTNPFFFQELPLFPKTSSSDTKVTEKEKALLEIFDSMVNNNAFHINTLPGIFKDEQLGYIAEIKGKLKTGGIAVPAPLEDDRFLYSGMMKSYPDRYVSKKLSFFRSSVPITYMVSHNADQDFLLMSDRQKEIKDIDKLFVSLQNKKPDETFKLEVTSTSIENDDLVVTDELDLSKLAADSKNNEEIFKMVKTFYTKYQILSKDIQFLSSLQKAPTLPIILVKDETPRLITKILNYNQNIDAPATTEYQIKSGPGDEELYKGQFRVNKRYNLRFKAGVVYSFLEQKDFTQSEDNTFVEKIEEAGIDGTFGIQIFPIKTDLRQINITKGRIAPFIYVGFSMKNIAENFYPGVGLEIFSGLSLSYNRHIGRSDTLITNNKLPQGIKTKWKSGNSVSLLVDGSLFVNLFKFGSNKSLLGL